MSGNETGNGKMKVVVTRDLGPDVMALLLQRTELDIVVWPENRTCERGWLLENIKGASAVLVMLTDKVNEELLDAAGPSLKVVSTMSVGYEHVHLPSLSRRAPAVRLGYTPDVLTEAVADLCVMLALMASRNTKEGTQLVQAGGWPAFTWSPFALCGPQLSAARTAGFVGFGRIAQATLRRLAPFGITRALYAGNPHAAAEGYEERDEGVARACGLAPGSVRRVPLEEVARESDLVIVLAPGGESTHHIVDARFLRAMRKHAVLVNAARGSLVDSEALAEALREGWIWGAGVDVVEGEPDVPLEHPLVNAPRCVVLPHLGSATHETRLGMGTRAAENLLGGLGLLEGGMPSEVTVR